MHDDPIGNATQGAHDALAKAKFATTPEDRKFHLNQAAAFAHLAEEARRGRGGGAS